MKLTTLLLGAVLVGPVAGTWSAIATDRATGQVGGAGATCRSGDGSSLLDDDFGSAAGKGALVGQDGAAHTGAWPIRSVESAETYMQDNAPTTNGYPDQLINVRGYTGNNQQWAVVDLDGNVEVSTLPVASTSADTTGHVKGDYTYSVQGNRLSNTNVVANAAKEFRKKGLKGRGIGKGLAKGKGGKGSKGGCDDLADRLMRSMEAAVKYGDGDSDCTGKFGYPADTAYLLVKKPDDGDSAGNEYARLDVVSGSYDAIAELRELYDDWREDNPCEERPKPHERFLPPLHLHGPIKLLAASSIVILIGLGLKEKKKRAAGGNNDMAANESLANSDFSPNDIGTAKDLSSMINRPPRTSFMQRLKAAMKSTRHDTRSSSDDAVFREEKLNGVSIYVNPYVGA